MSQIELGKKNEAPGGENCRDSSGGFRESHTETFPPPQLPLKSGAVAAGEPGFVRREFIIGGDEWNTIQKLALGHGFSPLPVFLSAFGEVLSRWSSGSELTVILMNDTRENVNPDGCLGRIDFKPAIPVVFKPVLNGNWIDTCRQTEHQLKNPVIQRPADILPIIYNTVNDSGPDHRDTVVIFSNGLSDFPDFSQNGENTENHIISLACGEYGPQKIRMPYTCLKCHVSLSNEGIKIVWYVLDELFPPALPDAMFAAYIRLLNGISEGTWEKGIPDILPESQRRARDQANSTFVPVDEKLIHQDFFTRARENPLREALLWDEGGIDRMMTYGELAEKALRLAALLTEKGVKQGDAVAVSLPRGPNQVIAVLGVLAAGAAYVPVGVNQPEGRRDKIYRIGRIRHLVTDMAGCAILPAPEDIAVILTDEADKVSPLPHPVSVSTDALAYVIFTSGSTGEPKGVEITHGAAYNTILDINTRFSVNETDRVLAVSALDFDLSVYDLFGLLSAGGGIVLLNEGDGREAPVWLDLIRRMHVTVWNSVPALFDMLMIAAGGNDSLASLRLVLVSGDWVGLDLHGRLKEKSQDCRFIALGGATEAAIWSNYFEVNAVDPSWSSIPYGKPLSNQCFRVVDRLGRDCPDMVAGELWIGGKGVARGYLGNPELTSKSFISTEDNRWYRTGDLGRYWPDGILEFLGRADQQVKLRGYRIELGEIEAALRQCAGVGQAVAVISSEAGSQHLMAAVIADSPAVQINAVSSVPGNPDSGSCRDLSREAQSKIAEALIAEILNLAELWKEPGKSPNLVEKLRITDGNRPLLRMWFRWLDERNVIKDDDGGLRAGPRIQEVLEYAGTLKRNAANSNGIIGDDPLISHIERRLFQRLDDYRGILSGDISATVLLDDDLLAPESLSSRDAGTISGIGWMAEKIKQMSQSAGKPVEAALMGGRSGIMAVMLLERLGPENISLTLLDNAPSMVEAARIRLSSLPHSVQCEILPENFVPGRFRYSFDAILAINSLHRYHDPYQGATIASLLARRGGKIFVLEHGELTPLAIVTSAVLDRGFPDLDHDRRQACNPMLPAQQWANLLVKAGFSGASFLPVEDSFSEFIEADCPASRPELDPDSLLKLAADHLPPHMMPERIEILPWLPLSSNGKVDRKTVAALFESRAQGSGGEKPHAGMEQEVAEMWKKLLDIGFIGRNQGFFAAGGDSLLATRFLAGVKEKYGIELSLRQMFESPSLFQVAAVLESKLTEMEQDKGSMEEGEI
jgi:dihydroaeruginoic acid synthetase